MWTGASTRMCRTGQGQEQSLFSITARARMGPTPDRAVVDESSVPCRGIAFVCQRDADGKLAFSICNGAKFEKRLYLRKDRSSTSK